MKTNGTCEENATDEYYDLREALAKGKIIQLNGTAVNGGYGETWNDCKQEDLFVWGRDAYRIKDKETYITRYTSQPKDLESALKKIENLHIALKKKVERNKNQALEITKLLEQKKDLQEALNINYRLIEEFTKIGVKYENKFDENKKTIERLNSIVEYLSKQLGLKVF